VSTKIKFGTSGWRAIIADEFTFAKISLSKVGDGRLASRGRLQRRTWFIGSPRLHRLELLETPVGFKFIEEYIKDGRIFLGVEESAGLFTRSHAPAKDGIIACLLLTEKVASRRKSLKTQLKELFSRTGAVYNRRLNVRLDPSIQARLKAELAAKIQEFHGRTVTEANCRDGLKLIFGDGGWVLMRPWGTEPVVRFYAESTTQEELATLLE
jgi:phosphoglucomutase